MRLTCIAVINRSPLFEGRKALVLDRIVRAVQTQIERDFAPAWGLAPVPVMAVDDGAAVPLGAGLVYLVQKIADAPGAYGIHKADPSGFFAGFVAVDAICKLGGTLSRGSDSVSSALSHEVLELIANPSVNLWCDDGAGLSFAREVCDPVSGDGYDIEVEPFSEGPSEAVCVSNFVHPDWFKPSATSGAMFDQMGLLTRQFEVRKGGYAVSRTAKADSVCTGQIRPLGGQRVGKLVEPANVIASAPKRA